jgi:hypothetical protein
LAAGFYLDMMQQGCALLIT